MIMSCEMSKTLVRNLLFLQIEELRRQLQLSEESRQQLERQLRQYEEELRDRKHTCRSQGASYQKN